MQSRGYGHETRGKGDILVGIRLLYVLFAPLAQLNRASGYEPGGRRFESCTGYKTVK